MTPPTDWNDIIDNAEAEHFVGREQELHVFRREITCTPPCYLVYYITGQGGVGKSTLLNRYQEIARDHNFLILDADEQQRDVPTVLARFAHQLAELRHPLKNFDEKYTIYLQKVNEVESDPDAPQDLAALVSKAVVRTAYIGGDLVPGVHEGLKYFPRESVETHTSEWLTYLMKKLASKEDVTLITEPIPILTPLFFNDLNELAEKHHILLCFENFEATRQELQDWLMKLPTYRPSPNIRLIIAGRDEPGAKWDKLRKVTLTNRLGIFTEKEAEMFLDAYGIFDPKRRMEILECSNRLPVLMSWLAVPEGTDIEPTLPTHDIVERFLRWVDQPNLRQIALTAAIPRSFNIDILKLLLDNQDQLADEQAAFAWLQTMPFVHQRSDGWQYHSVVRRMMLQHQEQQRPSTYRRMHIILADFYNMKCLELSAPDEEAWTNDQWRKYKLAHTYHFLVAHPTQHWSDIISLFVVAMRKRRSFAHEMMDLLSLEDIRDELSHEQNRTIHLFKQNLQAIKNRDLKDGFEMFNKICNISDLSSEAKSYAFSYRGEAYRLNKAWEKALSDFGNALQFLLDDAWAIEGRGETYRQMGRYEEALVDFERAITLDEKNAWAIASRGETYRLMGQYEEALVDFEGAITLDEKNAWAIASRGETYRQMRRYEEALVDLNKAITLDEKLTWAIAERGETYRQMGRYEEALENLDRAIAIGGNGYSNDRGLVLSYLGRYEEAINDYEQDLKEDPSSVSTLYNVAVVMVKWKGFPEAQTSVDKARQALTPLLDTDQSERGLYGLGGLEALANNNEQALAYLQQAISLGTHATDWARHDIAWATLRSTNENFQSLIFGTVAR